jgi:hypothetical protein
MLANEWDVEQLDAWGLDIPNFYDNSDEAFETTLGKESITNNTDYNVLINITENNILLSTELLKVIEKLVELNIISATVK